jgi:hypothetical protein
MIENKCYAYGDHDHDFQGWCIPTVSNTQWTKQSPTTTATPLPTTTAFLPPSSKASQGTIILFLKIIPNDLGLWVTVAKYKHFVSIL